MKLALKNRVTRTYDPQSMTLIVQQIEEQLNRLTEGRAGAYHGAAAAAPTTGEWVIGDWVKFSNPTSGGYFGAVCTASGTPGTWKSFGLIA